MGIRSPHVRPCFGTDSQAGPRRRWIARFALGALVIGGVTSARGLVSYAPAARAAAPVARPVTTAEAGRLAAVRLTDYRAGHVGVRATIGDGSSAVHLTGWVDWQAPLVYLNSIGAQPGPVDGLIQAVPGVVATRSGRLPYTASAAPDAPFPPPPAIAPPTGWTIRPPDRSNPIDTFITLLFTLRSDTLDDAGQIQAIGTRFVATDMIGGVRVDVLDGAAVPLTPSPAPSAAPATKTKTSTATTSPAGAPFAAQGGQVRYWVDAQSRLLRAEALITADTGVRVDFDRADQIRPQAIELLGGAAIHPKPVSAAQAKLLAGMRLRDLGTGGGRLTLALPNATNEMISGTGWLDWRRLAVYLAVRNNTGTGLLHADARRLALHGELTTNNTAGFGAPSATPPASATGHLAMPPLTAPKTGWTSASWVSRVDEAGQPDLDLLLNEMLSLAAPGRDSATLLRPLASKLRADRVNGVPVTVFEIRKPAERSVVPGYGKLRYWVDSTGLIRRLEVRMRNGAYGYLTSTPGAVPKLPAPK
jgi:hypothetical protein